MPAANADAAGREDEVRICRFDDDRLGVVRDGAVHDVTPVLKRLPQRRWPVPLGDDLIAHLDQLRPHIEAAAVTAPALSLEDVVLKSPVANPGKIIGAPVNYHAHRDEAAADEGLNFGSEIKTIETYGLFLKANSALVGPGEGVALRFSDRRSDHEVELAAVIGRRVEAATSEDALSAVAGYCIGLDMTVRGPEDRSLRKSVDSYAVLGPWLTTADEVVDPDNLNMDIAVNGEERQRASTSQLIFDIAGLIVYASRFFTLHPGDVIMTGTPEGVGPVQPGDVMTCRIQDVGEMEVAVRAHDETGGA